MGEIKCRVWTGTQYIYTRGDIEYFDNDGIEHMAQQVVFKDAWENVCIYDCTTNGTKTIKIIKDGIIEQYIGLRDCKRTEEYPEGQEIYEGDKIQGIHLDYYDHEKTIAIVEWDESGSWYPFANNQDEAPYPYPENCEIIGNIHEELQK